VGANIVVDGVSYAPHGLPDVSALGADIYLFSAYKTWGPHQGVMTVRRDLLDELTNQSHFFNADAPRYKLIPAGPDHAQVAALAGVVEYMDEVYEHHFGHTATQAERGRAVHDLFRSHEVELLSRLLSFLRGRDDVRIVGPDHPETRASTVSIVPLGSSLEDMAHRLAEHKVMVGVGNFYGYRPLDAMGIEPAVGVLRMSFIHYTTRDEIDQLVEGLEQAL
jgi:selenocysteine lyase/cysteine desulfurase